MSDQTFSRDEVEAAFRNYWHADPDHAKRRTRRDWGDGPDWARGTVIGADS